MAGNNVEGGVGKFSRHTMDANISAYDLASSYMVGYETAIKGGTLGVMCACAWVNAEIADWRVLSDLSSLHRQLSEWKTMLCKPRVARHTAG